ncbi:MAG: cysteine desulfurase family protein [bacterium]
MIYFDNAATTPVHPEVFQVMKPYFTEIYGNPNSKYYPVAEKAKSAVNNARETIAKYLGAKKDEVVFTSGGTESNNMIIKGIAFKHKPGHMVTTSIEHSSVYETMNYLEELGWSVTYLTPDSNGRVDAEELRLTINDNTKLVSIGWVNSEFGTIQDIQGLSKIAAESNVLFHTDATQAMGKMNLSLNQFPDVNLMTFSSHKIFGPKGVGAAVLRKDEDGIPLRLVPLLHGGEQEFNYRGGTLAVPNIVGFAKAVEIHYRDFDNNIKLLSKLDHHFINLIKTNLKGLAEINNDFESRVPGIINVRFKGFNNQVLLKNAKNIFGASTGSACSNSKPSRILKALGYDRIHTQESIRFSLSHMNTQKDIDNLIDSLT